MLLSWLALTLSVKRNTKKFWERAQKKDFPPVTKEIEELYHHHQKNNITVLGAYDKRFPSSLKRLPNCPPILFIKGDLSPLQKPCISIVGSRQGSLFARQWTKDIAFALSSHEWTIVSGLAKGIDGAAHQGALSTIAVVAGGVDYIYPSENKVLFEEIPQKGCIISEEPLGVKAQASFFPKRNHLIAGLSQALIVVEAAAGSGSLITVKAALDYGCSIFVVPGPPWDVRYSASLKLLREGALLCTNAQEVLEHLTPLTQQPLSFEKQTISPLSLPHLTEKNFLDLLSATPLPLHDLCNHYGAAQVSALITELELEGKVMRSGDGVIRLS